MLGDVQQRKKASENKSLSVHLNFSVACSRLSSTSCLFLFFFFLFRFNSTHSSRCRYQRPPDIEGIRNLYRAQAHTLRTSRRRSLDDLLIFHFTKVFQLLTARQTSSTHHPMQRARWVVWTNFMLSILRSASRISSFRVLLYSIHFQIIALLSVDSRNVNPDRAKKDKKCQWNKRKRKLKPKMNKVLRLKLFYKKIE